MFACILLDMELDRIKISGLNWNKFAIFCTKMPYSYKYGKCCTAFTRADLAWCYSLTTAAVLSIEFTPQPTKASLRFVIQTMIDHSRSSGYICYSPAAIIRNAKIGNIILLHAFFRTLSSRIWLAVDF